MLQIALSDGHFGLAALRYHGNYFALGNHRALIDIQFLNLTNTRGQPNINAILPAYTLQPTRLPTPIPAEHRHQKNLLKQFRRPVKIQETYHNIQAIILRLSA